jgi:uncharacterized protein with HEPN domain
MKPKDLAYIEHILEAIIDIEESTKSLSFENFAYSKDSKDACIRRLEIIGEAVKNISQETKNKYPKIEWKQIAGTRDRIIHAYFDVDLDIVWDIITKNLSILKKEMIIIEKNLKI